MTFERWRRHRFPALLVVAAMLLYRGCASAPKQAVLPTAIGSWQLSDSRATPVTPNDDGVTDSTAISRQVATHQGSGQMEVRLYRLTNSALGLDLVQRSHPSLDRVVFYRGLYFAAVSQQGSTPQALQAFASELNQKLPND